MIFFFLRHTLSKEISCHLIPTYCTIPFDPRLLELRSRSVIEPFPSNAYHGSYGQLLAGTSRPNISRVVTAKQ